MSKDKNPFFSDEYLTELAEEINEQFGFENQSKNEKADISNKSQSPRK